MTDKCEGELHAEQINDISIEVSDVSVTSEKWETLSNAEGSDEECDEEPCRDDNTTTVNGTSQDINISKANEPESDCSGKVTADVFSKNESKEKDYVHPIKPVNKQTSFIQKNKETSQRINTQRKQGLPNIHNNMCFMLAPIHMLASTIPENIIEHKEDLNEIIYEARKCIDGERQNREAAEIAHKLWDYSKTKWPEYEKDEKEEEKVNGKSKDGNEAKKCKQNDACEYLFRIINESVIASSPL